MRALAHQIGNDSVESDARQHQRDRGKRIEQNHHELLWRQRRGNDFIHRLRRKDHIGVVVISDDLSNRSHPRVHRSVDKRNDTDTWRHTSHGGIGKLPEGLVQLSAKSLPFVRVQAPLFHMTDYANYRLRILPVLHNSFADRIGVTKVLFGKDLIDNYHGRRSLIILIGKKASAFKWNAHGSQISRFDSIHQRHAHLALTRGLGLAFKPEEKIVFASQR